MREMSKTIDDMIGCLIEDMKCPRSPKLDSCTDIYDFCIYCWKESASESEIRAKYIEIKGKGN